MLEEISANDYGKDVPDHLAAIEQQLSDTPLKGKLGWCPLEVLELERWNELQLNPQERTPSALYGHRKRLLACILLLQSAGSIGAHHTSEEDFFLDTSASTLIQLTRSVIWLGSDGPTLALGFLSWLYGAIRYPRLLPFIAFSVFLLWLEGHNRYRCEAIKDVWQWVLNEESHYREQYPLEIESELWLVGISGYEDSKGHRLRWFNTSKEVLTKTRHCRDEINEILHQIERLQVKGR